jgi:peptidoglycan-N-acetylglucosamine deacetylase
MLNANTFRAGVCLLLALAASGARAEEPAQRAEPNGLNDGIRVDACASDPSRLGLSRIVEIDTADGPQFGGGHGAATDFLKDGEVILTFDDGPLRPYTRPVLKALADQCTKATFFMVGRMAAADPALVKDVAAAGHTVASHTWSHQNLMPIGLLKSRQEFEKGVVALNKALGRPAAAFFRFPYLSENRFLVDHIKSRNISTIWVDVDSKDYLTRDPKQVHNRIMSQLREQRKGIILMHDIQPSTAGAIRGLLSELRDKGFKVVHIVPKASADAVALSDSDVEKTFADKAKASGENPVASRSVVWTMAPTATGAIVAPTKNPAARPTVQTTAAPSPPQSAEEELPWLKPGANSAPQVKAAAKPKKPAAKADESWSAKIFGY